MSDDHEWHSIVDDPPWWDDDGSAEMRRADGSIVKGQMEIDAGWVDGEEVPIFQFTTDDGRTIAADDFQEWRSL